MPDVHRLLAPLFALVRQMTARVDYFALYACRVVSQNDDGTLDLRPDVDTFGPGLQKVSMRLGLPGVTAKVKKDSRVLLGFENGDATKPIATLWDVSSLDEIKIVAQTKITALAPKIVLVEGGLPAARQGDMVAIGGGLPAIVPPPPNAVLQFADGGPIVPGKPYIVACYFTPLPYYGVVTSGNPSISE